MAHTNIGMQMGIYTWNSHMKEVNHMVSGHGGLNTITIKHLQMEHGLPEEETIKQKMMKNCGAGGGI